MKRIVFLFLMLCVINSLAQKQRQARMDSLLAELPRLKDDQTKLNLYLDIIATYNEFNQEEALKYEKPALVLAQNLNSKTGVADVKNAIGRVFWRKGFFEEARNYHGEAKRIFEEMHDQQKIALTYRFIGQDYADGGNYPEALKNLSIALSMYTELGDRKRMAYIHSLKQWVYGKQGDYAEAAKSGYAALKLYDKIGDKDIAAIASSDIAENYLYIGNYSEALKFFQRSTKVYRSNGDSTNVAYSYNLIGITHKLLGDYSRSLKNHQAALAIGKDINDANIMANAYDGMADVHKLHNENEKALTEYLLSARLFKTWSNKRDMARVYCKIGECYRILRKYDSARKYLNNAFDISNELGSKTLVIDYYRGAALLDSALGNWKNAYINYKKFAANRDSVFNQEKIRKIVQLDLVHEFDKKEAAARAEQEKKDFERRIQFISLSSIAALILILAIVLFRNQKRKAKINEELRLKSEKLEQENHEKTSILNIVSHDLKAPFNKIKGLTDLIGRTDQLSVEERDEYLSHIRSSIDQGNYLIRNLLDSQSVENESNKAINEAVNLHEFIQRFQVDTNGQLLKKAQNLQTYLEGEIQTVITDKQMLTRILDNLVSNASKFSDKGKSIHLSVWTEQKYVFFSVRDEGPGISDEDQKKMFRKFQLLSARPTGGETSTGLGLSITKALVEKLKGQIRFESKLGEGTKFIVILPLL